MNKLKILQINKLYYPVVGGIEKIIQQLAEGLNEKTDMKVLVCSKKGKGCFEKINGVEVNRANSMGIFFSMPISFSFIFMMRKMAKDRDVLVFHMPFPLGDLAGLLSGFKGKIIVWWHSDVVKQEKVMRFYEPIMRKFLNRADTIIVATQGHIEGSKYLRDYREKCVIVPYGVDGKIMEDSKKYCAEYKNNKEIIFLFVGRFVYYKGCSVLLEAFSKVKQGKLILAGDGVLRQELMEQAERLGIAKKVEFVINPSDERVMELYRECDVFVLPSIQRSEAFGLVQAEAMAYGKPVINTNLESGVPYVSLDGKTGLTVEVGSVKKLAEAMIYMIENAEIRRNMGIAARKRAYEVFTEEKMIEETLRSITMGGQKVDCDV